MEKLSAGVDSRLLNEASKRARLRNTHEKRHKTATRLTGENWHGISPSPLWSARCVCVCVFKNFGKIPTTYFPLCLFSDASAHARTRTRTHARKHPFSHLVNNISARLWARGTSSFDQFPGWNEREGRKGEERERE